MSASETTCRLCGLSCEQSIHIFDRPACVNMLQYKIKQLLDVAVGRSDNLPHSVCLLCVNKLDSFWCFKNACQRVQIKLRKMNGSKDADCNRLQSKSVPSINMMDMMATSGFKTHVNDSSTSRPSHEKELDPQSPSTSKSSIPADLLGNKENLGDCSDEVSKQTSTFTNIDSASLPLAVNLEKDYHNRLGEQSLLSRLLSVSNDRPSGTTSIHTRGVDNCIRPTISDDEDNDDGCNGIIEEDDTMSIASEENVNVECSVDILCSSDMNSALSESTGQSLADSNCQKVNESTSVCEDVENSEISSLSATTGSEIAPFFEGHFYRMETNNDSDLLCNRIPYLLVESKMGTKHMIYTIYPDPSKFDIEHNYMFNPDGVYLTLEKFDLENPNVILTLIEWLNNILKGEISLMPYYFGWLDSKKQLSLGFKCILCKKCICGKRQMIMNHIADHLLWSCPVCGKFCRCMSKLTNHLLKHEAPTFECSTCGEKFVDDFEKYKVHKRGHYKFECFSCRFECSDEEKWLKHLKNDQKKVESCSSDCCLFYENLEQFQNHVSALATLGGYVCGACGMVYHCEEYLKLHLRVHGLEHSSKTTELPGSTSSENELKNFQIKIDRLKNSDDLTHYDTLKKILANEIDSKEFQTFSVAVGGKVSTGFMCFKCNRILATEKKFKVHIGNHLMMTCQCKRYLRGIGRLRDHLKNWCSFKRRMCVWCRNNVWLNTSVEYLDHLSLHQKRRICIYCQQVFLNSEKLERHIESFHYTENDKTWFCEHCNESLVVVTYKSLDAFKFNHLKERHPDKLESCICDICGETFLAKHALTAHRMKHLPKKNNNNFICAYCNKTFSHKHTLIAHIGQHMNEKNFKCEICEKAFNRETSLTKHKLDMHSLKKHACNLCEKKFSYPSALRDHVKRAHTFVRSVQPASSADSSQHRSVQPASSADISQYVSAENPFQDAKLFYQHLFPGPAMF